MSEQNESVSPPAEKSTPRKRSRLSLAEKVKRESEEVLKQMGSSIDIEGGRKTRSSTRNSGAKTPATPPPTKRSKASTPSTSSARRGRPKKLEEEELSNDGSKSEKSEEADAKKTPESKKSVESKDTKKITEIK